MAKINLRIRDYSDEYSGMGVNAADLGTIETWDLADGTADDLITHVEAHTIGTVVSVYWQQETQAANDARPASAFAQRELGFRFYVRDSVTEELGFFTIPCADLAIGSVVAGDDELNLAAAPTAAFVTFIEASLLSRDGNAVTVERALVVGRNS